MDTMMDKQIRTVLERVADGVWEHHGRGWIGIKQCAFCCRSPEAEHEKDCPVRLAREILERENG